MLASLIEMATFVLTLLVLYTFHIISCALCLVRLQLSGGIYSSYYLVILFHTAVEIDSRFNSVAYISINSVNVFNVFISYRLPNLTVPYL
jgi:hypothetical protein